MALFLGVGQRRRNAEEANAGRRPALQEDWCRLRDSNPRPTVYKTVALPTELNRRVWNGRSLASSGLAPAQGRWLSGPRLGIQVNKRRLADVLWGLRVKSGAFELVTRAVDRAIAYLRSFDDLLQNESACSGANSLMAVNLTSEPCSAAGRDGRPPRALDRDRLVHAGPRRHGERDEGERSAVLGPELERDAERDGERDPGPVGSIRSDSARAPPQEPAARKHVPDLLDRAMRHGVRHRAGRQLEMRQASAGKPRARAAPPCRRARSRRPRRRGVSSRTVRSSRPPPLPAARRAKPTSILAQAEGRRRPRVAGRRAAWRCGGRPAMEGA